MEILRNFGIQPLLLAAQIVNFLIILFLLKKFFYKPIVKALEDRKTRIAESLKNADLIEENLKKTEVNSAKILEDAQLNAQQIIQNATKEAERIIENTYLESKKATVEELEKVKIQIQKGREQMKEELEKETLILVAGVVKKILGRSLKETERQSLTSKAITDISKFIK